MVLQQRKVNRYLHLPFRGSRFFVEEGWYYSAEEHGIHHYKKHGGIDFRLRRGTSILAAHSGYALASYQHNIRRYRGRDLMYQGKPVGFGLGYLVVIWNPGLKRGTLYGHLQKASPALPHVRPTGKFPNLKSRLFSLRPSEFVRRGKRVRAGQVIGWCGDQGCTWGYSDYPRRPDPRYFPSWDGAHLHFEEFGKPAAGRRVDWRDPFGVYGFFKQYPRRVRRAKLSLWI
ncbi:MAG: M23 family metallopeptidase [Candidatus Kerfeldbacteria bacterium]|nr:M23 family metallopeptidase [Candidatus Kerfeldbacteria bacterium]